jgi:RNA polymerase sigma-70 factor (family 1)
LKPFHFYPYIYPLMADNTSLNIELFTRLADGDETAFRQLYDQYRIAFYSAAYRMTHSTYLSEEVVQEVFVALWQKRAQVATAANPVGYLMTMLHNSIYAQFRKILLERQVRARLAEDSNTIEDNPVEEWLLAKENHQLFQAIIGQLPPQQQMVYKLARQQGLSREEIARQLNISPNTVRNHLAAAIEFIRNYIKKTAPAIIWSMIWQHL